MNWYLVKLVFQIVNNKLEGPAQFEEQLRLISSSNEDDALEKSYELGRNGQLQFYSQHRQLVQWKFINVSELYLLSEYLDGAELYSTITELSCAASYIRLVNDKSAMIHQKDSRKQLNLV